MKVTCRSCGLVQPPASWCRSCASTDVDPLSQMEAMTARVIRESLDIVRAEAESRETADRLRRVCDEAVAARRALLDSPEMPAPGYDAQTRLVR
jgi:hypothetical protein